MYRYDLDREELLLLVKEQLQSITLTGSSLTYRTTSGDPGILLLDLLPDLDEEKAKKVKDKIIALKTITDQEKLKKAVIEARQLYMTLTKEQKDLVTNYNDLIAEEVKLGNDITTQNTKKDHL